MLHQIEELHQLALYECEQRNNQTLRKVINLIYRGHLALLRMILVGVNEN